MKGAALRRLAGLALTLLVASFLIYAAVFVAPGGALGTLTGGRSVSPQALATIKAEYHLDDSFLTGYLRWLSGTVRGDLGYSVVHRQSVSSLLGAHYLTTLLLVVYSSLLVMLAGVGLGVVAGVRGGKLDQIITVVTSAAFAIPAFVAAVALVALFAVELGWFPIFGSGDGFGDRLHHLTLPAIALALSVTGFVARVTRAAIRDELRSEHVRASIGRGLPWPSIVRGHIVRNAMIPIATTAGLVVASLLAVSTVVEYAFQLNGLGSFLVDAVQQKDIAVVQAVSLLYVAAFVVCSTAIDLLYPLIDPRVKAQASR